MNALAIMAPETLLLIIGLIAACIIVFVVIQILSYKTIVKLNQESKSYAYKYTSVETKDASLPDLQTLYMEKLHERGSLILYSRENEHYCTDHLLLLLEGYYDKLTFITRYADKLERKDVLYMSAQKGDDVVYLQLDNRQINIDVVETVQDYKLNDYIVITDEAGNVIKDGDVYLKDKVYPVIFVTSVIKMVYPTNRQNKDEIMTGLLEKTILKYRKNQEPKDKPIRLYTITKKGKQYTSNPVLISAYLQTYNDKALDIIYGKCDFNWKGEELTDVPVSKVIQSLLLGIDDLQNTAIFGKKGSGKSYLQDIISHKLAANPAYRVYQVSAAHDFSSMEFQSLLEEEFSDILNPNEVYNPNKPPRTKNIIVLDEAHIPFLIEKDPVTASILIQMMDGAFQRKYNLCWIMVINSKKDELLGDIFREGRLENQITLKPLRRDDALILANWIDKNLDQERYYYNYDQFERGLAVEQYVGGVLQANVEELTQSFIFNCTKLRRQADVLGDSLDKPQKQSKLVISPKALSKSSFFNKPE